jgi:hypothetical protein
MARLVRDCVRSRLVVSNWRTRFGHLSTTLLNGGNLATPSMLRSTSIEPSIRTSSETWKVYLPRLRNFGSNKSPRLISREPTLAQTMTNFTLQATVIEAETLISPVAEESGRKTGRSLDGEGLQKSEDGDESGPGASWRLGFIREIEDHLGGRAS